MKIKLNVKENIFIQYFSRKNKFKGQNFFFFKEKNKEKIKIQGCKNRTTILKDIEQK